MNNGVFWKYIAYGYFLCSTLAVVTLLEFLVFGKPYITIFLAILAVMIYINLHMLRKDKQSS